MADDVPLYEHYKALFEERDRRFDEYKVEHERFVEAALAGLRDSSERTAAAMEKRFDRVDEQRQELERRVQGLMPRVEAEARMNALADRVDTASKGIADRVDAMRTGLERAAPISREFFDRYQKEEGEKHNRVLDQLAAVFSEVSNIRGRAAAYAAAVGIGVSLLGITVGIFMKVVG